MASSSTKDTAHMNFFKYVASLEIPLKDIESATNNFADENIIARGSYATVYKGQLLQSGDWIDIVVRKCLAPNVTVVVNDITMYKDLRHQNIISLFKVDDTKDQALTIHKYEANQSLDKHLGSSTVTWMQRLQICVGIAQALRYLHFGLKDDEYSVIHGNVKSSKILLDQDWEPKLHDFRCAVKVKRHDLYITGDYNGTSQYMDPAFESTGGLTHKSDVFSFGVVLFEVLFGRKASIPDEPKWHFAELARLHYEEESLDDMIDPDLRSQMNVESLNIFSETAYRCLKEQRAERPDMDQILNQLKTALEHQRNPVVDSPAAVEGASSSIFQGGCMDHLKVPLSEIKRATNNFSETFLKGKGGYGMVYITELQCSIGIATVAVKRIRKRRDTETEKSFMEEINMLVKATHKNVISLLGFCDEDDEMILICEYASKGSLNKYLGIGNMMNFTWAQRIKLCLGIANGLHHLHNGIHGENTIIHRDIKSENILLDDEWVPKIADFGLSKLYQKDQKNTHFTNHIAGTQLYMDPEYEKSGRLKQKSDIYSFGVVLFEILCGRLAYDEVFEWMGLAAKARQCHKEGTIDQLVDPRIKEDYIDILKPNGGVNQKSLDKFSEIAHKCVAEHQENRPAIEDVIKELEEALNYQENNKNNLLLSFEDIQSWTQNFNDMCEEGRHWKQYKGEITHVDESTTNIVAKRWDNNLPQCCRDEFSTELKILYKYKHENIITLKGFCTDNSEQIIVYKAASYGTLDKHLEDSSLTWMRRLKICIDIAKGLEFLHSTSVSVMHRDIKSASILLDDEWSVKISNLELSIQLSDMKSIDHVTEDDAYGSHTCVSDIFSLGVVLKEVLEGRSKKSKNLVVSEGINEQIDPKSLNIFKDIVSLCLAYSKNRPRVTEVITKLQKALNLQISSMRKIYESIEMKKDLYNIVSKGILLKRNKVWLSHGSNGEINEMISARNFSYKNHDSLKWRSVKDSRFPKVAEIIDLSNLKVHIKIRTQFISPSVNHKVHLIFRFWGPIRKPQAKRVYVNLKYKMGKEMLHAYFATWREDGWMMLELFQPLNHHEDTDDFEVQLESITRGYCGNSSIYIEGIEFQATENASHEDSKRLKGVQNVWTENTNMDEEETQEMMLSAKEVVNTPSDTMGRYIGRNDRGMRMFRRHLIYQESSRFNGAIEFQRHHVFRIKCKIQRHVLSANTKNVCYLVFKLSEKCRGLHAPVLVRDPRFHRKRREIVHFRSPQPVGSSCDGDWIPEKRNDGWMEVIVWIFNSGNEIKYDHLSVNLKLVTYEGTMAGLIVRGIEFRPPPREFNDSSELKKDIDDIFCKGTLLKDYKVWLSLGSNGERNELISARIFSYHSSIEWRFVQDSRFPKVAEIFDLQNLNVHIKIRSQFISPTFNHKVHLIFRFSPRKSQAKRMYVNLKYKMGNETLHAYFATWREDGWMMIELFQSLNKHEVTDHFEVQLESISPRYCENSSIYIQGIEFQAIENVNHEEDNESLKEIQKVLRENSNIEEETQEIMLSAKEVVDTSYTSWHPHIDSEAIEFQRHVLFRIKYKIERQILSANTKNVCYLVFKLSEKCHGLHGPVLVRNHYHRKERGILYLRSPHRKTSHDGEWIPKRRKDGWMEVIMWVFNSGNEIKNDHLSVNLKLITYEGTMSGLVVRGIEFRPKRL